MPCSTIAQHLKRDFLKMVLKPSRRYSVTYGQPTLALIGTISESLEAPSSGLTLFAVLGLSPNNKVLAYKRCTLDMRFPTQV